MIDIERDVFITASRAVKAQYPDIYFTNEYVRTPPKFPCASLEERDNRNDEFTQDSSSNENTDTVIYELNVYSNKTSGKKSEAKSILNLLDTAMTDMGFTRTMMQPIPNMEDATLYRITARYIAVVDKNRNIYGR